MMGVRVKRFPWYFPQLQAHLTPSPRMKRRIMEEGSWESLGQIALKYGDIKNWGLFPGDQLRQWWQMFPNWGYLQSSPTQIPVGQNEEAPVECRLELELENWLYEGIWGEPGDGSVSCCWEKSPEVDASGGQSRGKFRVVVAEEGTLPSPPPIPSHGELESGWN